MEVDQVETETDRGNQVDRSVFAKELPTEHPVGAIGEPFHVIKRIALGAFVSVFVHRRIARCRTLGYLRCHEVEVEPSQELFVLGTDVHVHTQVPVAELLVAGVPVVFDQQGVDATFGVFDGSFGQVAVVGKRRVVHIALEFPTHAAVVRANRNEPTDVVLFVKPFFFFGKGAGGEGEQAESNNAQKRGYLCFHKRFH